MKPGKKSQKVVTSIRIDPEIWKEARKLSIDLGSSVGEFMENIIKKELKERKKK